MFASQPWSKAGLLWGCVCVASVGLTHTLRGLIQRNDWLALRPAALLGRIVAMTVLNAIVSYLLTIALTEAIYGVLVTPIAAVFYQRLPVGQQLFNEFVFTLAVQSGWVALYLAFTMQRHRYRAELRQAQLGEALQAAELRLLKSQLNPHFLFNALNGVRSLIAEQPDRARSAVTHLARTLRYTLASNDEDLVSLERELEMVDDYLALESMRLEDRLQVERAIAPEARTVRVPTMLVQTLVENSIKHGISALKEGGTLSIAARVESGELMLEIRNPRPAEAANDSPGGVGLRNASERLRLLFGPRARLDLDVSQPGIATAVVRLPA